MKTLKKVGAFALVLALMVTILSGCADPQTNNGGNATTNPTKAPDQSVEPEKTEEPRETYAITIMNSGNAERYPEEILIQEKMEEALNLDITIESAPGTSYLESIQMMLTSGDYPELVIFNDEMKETLFTDAVKNGAFIALDDYLVNSPNLMEYSYDASWEALKVLNDDKVYGIPRTSIARADGYLIRQDWLDKVGISYTEGEPMTIAQLEEIVEAFTNDDPDGNSANDTYGISAYATPNGTMEVLFPSTFGLLGWQNYDGEYMDIKYSLDHDNFEKALTFSNKMWEAGFVDPDWPTIQLDVGLERFKKGVTGAFFPTFAGSMLGVENGGRDMNPDYTLSYVVGVVENAGDQVIAGNYSTGYYGFWGVSSAAEKPERVVELLDYMLSDEIWDEIKYGPKGVTWEEQNGQKVDIWDPEK
ncbi:MAG: extracellular solute-binding protein, partial [Clostridiales bacterium]|nr:extracellular solute-binding protein [Clostridiales bacterium]